MMVVVALITYRFGLDIVGGIELEQLIDDFMENVRRMRIVCRVA